MKIIHLIKLLLLTLLFFSIGSNAFTQKLAKRGTIKVRKKIAAFYIFENKKNLNFKNFTSRENPIAGIWKLVKYEVDGKKQKSNKNRHIIEFYDSTYHFRRIYTKPISRVFEGTFPVGKLRNKINRINTNNRKNNTTDSIVKFKQLDIIDYHLLYVEDSLKLTDLVNFSFRKFIYNVNSKEIKFEVHEKDMRGKTSKTMLFIYRKISPKKV